MKLTSTHSHFPVAPHCSPTPARMAAFTLIELLTVIVIIGVLCAIILPVTAKVRQNARTAQCLSNLRQIGLACLMYADEHRGLLPTVPIAGIDLRPDSEKGQNWHTRITPYMSMDNKTARARFNCPEATPAPAVGSTQTTYRASWFLTVPPLSGRVINLTSHVVLAADGPVSDSDGIWPWNYSGYSGKPERQQMHRHNGGKRQNAVFTDGSAKSMNGIQAGAFRISAPGSSTPNAWCVSGAGYVNNGYDTNPGSPSDFVP